MVKALSHKQQEAVRQALHDVERDTSAHIAVVTAAASDSYVSMILLYGLIVGGIAASALWVADIISAYPLLLAVQLGCVILLSLPRVRNICIRLAPKHLKYRRAAHRAYEEYLFALRHVPHDAPMALLYVSLAERYAHILTNPVVRGKMPDETWNEVVAEFSNAMRAKGLEQACLGAVSHMAQLLAPSFPAA